MQTGVVPLLVVRVDHATDRRHPLDERRERHHRLQREERGSRDPAEREPGSEGEAESAKHQ